MIPKLSAPLVKLIRTGEGILLYAFNAAAIVLGAVNDVSPATAIKYAGIFNAVAFASRCALKAVAALKPTVGEPIAPQWATLTGTTPNTSSGGQLTVRKVAAPPTPEVDAEGWPS